MNLVHFRIGEMALKEKKFRECLVSFEKIDTAHSDRKDKNEMLNIFIDPGLMTAKNYLLKGEAYLRLNIVNKGIDNLKRFIDDYPGIKGLEEERLKAGLYLQQSGENEYAIKSMRQLIALSEDNEIKAEAQYWIGESFFKSGDKDRAVIEYLKVTYLYPQEGMWAVTARYMAANASREAGRYEDALKLYKVVARESDDEKKRETAKKRVEELLDEMAGASDAVE